MPHYRQIAKMFLQSSCERGQAMVRHVVLFAMLLDNESKGRVV
jgi:hypothetical protein